MSASLYNDAIMALARSKSGGGSLDSPDGVAEADNPLCGDRIRLQLAADAGRVAEIAHETRGCLLTEAAAALVADGLRAYPLDGLDGLHDAVKAWLRGEIEDLPLSGLDAFTPVRAVRSRHECVLLPFVAAAEAAREA
ncbi:MAG: iron-sulfur cluster assembly scaffold protein [Geminicoccaceae bacterium]|nr:iron-sulfur cluster assembly scaffold protein [Geminicoccaceae bacterium]